jgi:hypothetical protein
MSGSPSRPQHRHITCDFATFALACLLEEGMNDAYFRSEILKQPDLTVSHRNTIVVVR